MSNDNRRIPTSCQNSIDPEVRLRNEYLIPIYICRDSGVSDKEYKAAIEGIMTIVKLSGQHRKIVSYGKESWSQGEYSSCDWYVNNAIHKGNQIDGDDISRKMIQEPWQEYPNTHLDVVVTSRDLFAQNLNWVFGVTFSNYISVQSIYRFRNEKDEIKLGLICRTLKHEVGHLLGIPGPVGSHPRIYDKGGPHCSNICLMRQGWSLVEFKEQMLEEKRLGIELCSDCIRELKIQQTLKPIK